jgi:hypothetical protein
MKTLSIINEITFLGISLINVEDFVELFLRLIFNSLVCFIIIRFLYYKTSRRKDYFFTYFLISTVVFFLCILLDNVKLGTGFALGLFAIFSIIRYRTNPIPIKEMTYLFIIIGVSVINALSNKKVSYAEMLFTNFSIILITWGLESVWLLKNEACKLITYERIDLIKPENRAKLIEDLENRTGLRINRIEIGPIDFLKDTAQIIIFYFDKDKRYNLADEMFKKGRGRFDDGD